MSSDLVARSRLLLLAGCIALMTAIYVGECHGALAVADPLGLGGGLVAAADEGWHTLELPDVSQFVPMRTGADALGDLSHLFPLSSSSSEPLPMPADGPGDDRNDDGCPAPSEVIFIASPASPGSGASGTSTSLGGSSGTSVFPIDSAAASLFSDTGLVTWLCGEQRFTLPKPRGNDLLRPPECC